MRSLELKKYYFHFLFSLVIILFLFQLGARDLWEPDETRYAVVAREMREGGNWILPQLNRVIYAEKPPLFFWLINLSSLFLGEDTEFSNRLPSSLAGMITILMTYYFGKRIFNPQVGFLSGLILVTCFLFPQLSRWVMLDSILTLFFLLTLYFFYRGLEEDEKRKKLFLLAGLFMGLGVLTKGPLAFFTIPILLIFAFSQRKLKKFWCRDLLWGLLLSLGIVLIWWIPVGQVGENTLTGFSLSRLLELM